MPENVFLIGKILQKYRLVTNEQWTEAVRAHERLAGRVAIPELLLGQGLLSGEQARWLERAVRHCEIQLQQRRAPPGGEPVPQRQEEQGESPSRGAVRLDPHAVERDGEVEPMPLSDTPMVLPAEGGDASQTPVEPLGDAMDDGVEGLSEFGPPPEEPRHEEPPAQEVRRSRPGAGRVAIGAMRIGTQRRREPENTEGGPLEDLHRLLAEAGRAGASDLLLSPGQPPTLRVGGEFQRLPAPRGGDLAEAILPLLCGREEQRALRERGVASLVHVAAGLRCRLTVTTLAGAADGHHLAFRLHPQRPQGLEELGLPPILGQVAALPAGLVLIAGPPGSGRTTTLGALLEQINGRRDASVLVLQDAPELQHRPRRAHIAALCARPAALPALAPALATDGDILAVDELRGGAEAALALAEAGLLVLCVVSAPDAAAAIEALLAPDSDGPGGPGGAALRRRVSRTLMAVVAQRLLRRAGGRGLVAAVEVVLGTPAVLDLIGQDRLGELGAALQRERGLGPVSLSESLRALCAAGAIGEEDAEP